MWVEIFFHYESDMTDKLWIYETDKLWYIILNSNKDYKEILLFIARKL